MKDIAIELLRNNPNLFSVVLLPLLLLLITAVQNVRIKKLENNLVLDKEIKTKALDVKFNAQKELRDQQKVVHTSLVRILFDIQKLHISLSIDCDDKNCVEDGLKKFNAAFDENQNLISANLLCLPSVITNHIYRFYKKLAELIIELQGYKRNENYELSIVSVYLYARLLADEIIAIQNYITRERMKEENLEVEFKEVEVEMMRYCCGQIPPKDLQEKYENLKGIKIKKMIMEEKAYLEKLELAEIGESIAVV